MCSYRAPSKTYFHDQRLAFDPFSCYLLRVLEISKLLFLLQMFATLNFKEARGNS